MLAADLNNDGFVDGADLAIWEVAYGLSNAGDVDFDDDTDGTDFLIWQQSYTGAPAPSADFDFSGSVDDLDLAIWEASFGVNDSGDADHDGDSDGKDFLIWQQQFAGALLVAASAQVPEPSTLVMALVVLTVLHGGSRTLLPGAVETWVVIMLNPIESKNLRKKQTQRSAKSICW